MIIIWLIGFVISIPAFIKIAASTSAPPFNDTLDYVMSAFVVLLMAFIWPITLVLGSLVFAIKTTVEKQR